MITIFTPTYNRCHLLYRLYKSLCSQTCFDFEWLVIDDGSTDDTKVYFETLSSTQFSVRYYYQDNAGKHIAINRGANLAKGEWLFIVDSDDYLTEDAVCVLKRWTATIQNNYRFCAVVINHINKEGKLLGSPCTYDILDTDELTYRLKYKFEGDHHSCMRTSVWKEFQFPEFEGERFCSEALVLRRIAQKYICRFVNENIYVAEYLQGGLSDTAKYQYINSPHYAALLCFEQIKLSGFGFRARIAAYYFYWKYYRLCSQKYTDISPTGELIFLGFPVYFLCGIVKGF